MTVSDAQMKATRKYNAKTYDQIKILIRKDADLNADVIREYCTKNGESLNGFLKRAVEETIARDKLKG